MANRKISNKEEGDMGQLGGFSLAIHLAIILLSAILMGLDKLVKAALFIFLKDWRD